MAQQLAYQAPARVRSLILMATVPGMGGRPPAPWVLPLMAWPVGCHSRTYRRMVTSLAFGGGDAAALAGEDGRLPRPSVRGYAQQMYAITGWSSLRWLHKIPQRTLVLSARNDPLASLHNGRTLAARIPHAQFEPVAGGHMFLLENPTAVCPRIERFLDEQEASGGRLEAEHA